MGQDRIVIRGARQHNLKNIDLELPRDKLIVITGLSGSGKSSLAFDTLYAEGQRRYVESLSAYARQFLGQMDKPDVDLIEGLSPAISIDQKTTTRNPRSTVGTVTEIYDYLRLLFARVGHPHCPNCGRPISQQTVEQMVDRVMELPEGTRVQVLAPLVRGRKGEHEKVFDEARRAGFVRVRIDGEVRELAELPAGFKLEKNKKHTIEVVVDRIVVRPGARTRLADSIETALGLAEGLVLIDVVGGEPMLFSQHFACPECGTSLEELSPRMFSFNSPYGACPVCSGLGSRLEIDPELVIPDRRKSLADGAVVPWSRGSSNYYPQLLAAVARHFGVDWEAPLEEAGEDFIRVLLYGTREPIRFRYENRYGRVRDRYIEFEGVVANLERRYREATTDTQREEIEQFMSAHPCPACRGARLRPESLAVTVGGKNIAQVTAMSVRQLLAFLDDLQLSEREAVIAREVVKEIRARLHFLADVGLDYLTLDRPAGTLSGGEAQRIRLATQIGSGLVGVLYILDEPSIGLHQRDNARLIATLQRLRDLGNTLVVVEHDQDMMEAADFIVDIGPGAGEHGGRVVVAGTLEDVLNCPESVTGQYLSGRRAIPVPERRRRPNGRWLVVRGAREHNLKGIDVRFPLNLLVCVTGVSGSGKSTLVNDILYRRLAQHVYGTRTRPGEHDGIEGLEHVRKVVNVDQSPIGRTPRSNPATYTGVFDFIRELFAATPEARMRGYTKGRFSFNVRGGRCEACNGDGIIKIEMHFLPDVYVPCEVCKGKRYNRETLEIKYKGKSIADVLDMTVEEALEFFAAVPRVRRKLQTLYDVGLGYIRLGQPATELSGGEAQRVKLATELSRRSDGGTVYILDEPTTGLHFADIHRLVDVLQRLVDAGDTVIVIEHNLDVVKVADWVIDLGPEGGEAGGRVVAEGPPEAIMEEPASYTGRFLKQHLERQARREREARREPGAAGAAAGPAASGRRGALELAGAGLLTPPAP
ncbi:excinuclease ABC subunit UvrA [Thermaerobacter litoralis]